MVANPFNSQLVPGIFGTQEGLIARVKTTLMNPAPADQTCGFMLWAPDYTNAGAETPKDTSEANTQNIGANLFFHYGDDPSVALSNENSADGENFGFGNTRVDTGAPSNLVFSMKDPASNLLRSTIVADARTLSAGIRVTYTGALINAGGQFAILTALPLGTLLNGGADGGVIAVNDLFQYATDTGRIDREPIEVKARPDDSSNVFRSDASRCMAWDENFVPPNVRTKVATYYTSEGLANQPQFFGIAWRGLPAGVTNPMTFDIVKALEWRPDMVSGLTQVPKHAYHAHSQMTRATQLLDMHHKGWATKPNHHVGLAHVLDDAVKGALSFAKSSTGQMLQRGALQYAARALVPGAAEFSMAAPAIGALTML